MLQVERVSKRFTPQSGPVDALRGVDLSVERGSFTAVLGASGSGKTTLLRVIAGFDRPDSGMVELDGRIVAGPSVFVAPERRNVGIVAQDGALFPHLDVRDNIAYGLRERRFGRRRRRLEGAGSARVEDLLRLVGLAGYGSRRPNELSGGQQQRVALARALAPAPGLLLMDEPFSALDAGLRVSIREEVRDLLRGLGTTVVLVTHDQNEALSMADHVVIMRDGDVVQAGSPSELYRRPADLKTAEFLGAAVVLPARVLTPHGAVGPGDQVECALGVVPVAHDPDEQLAHGSAPNGLSEPTEGLKAVIRPEQLVFSDSGSPGTVRSISFYGHDGTARVMLDESEQEVVVRTSGLALPAVGQRVGVAVRPGADVRLIS